ncbi:hypothetical protein TELCIR_11340, partial [Teladorsagia circumcincta]
ALIILDFMKYDPNQAKKGSQELGTNVVNKAKSYWYDEFLTWKPEEFGGVTELHVPSHMIWRPDLLVYNKYSISECQKEFIQQICYLLLASWSYDGSQIMLYTAEEPTAEPSTNRFGYGSNRLLPILPIAMSTISSCKANLTKAYTALEVAQGKVSQHLVDPFDVSSSADNKHQLLSDRHGALETHISSIRSALRLVRERQQAFLTFVGNSTNPEVDNEAYCNYMQETKIEDAIINAEDLLRILQANLDTTRALLEEHDNQAQARDAQIVLQDLDPEECNYYQLVKALKKRYDRPHKTRAMLHKQLQQLPGSRNLGPELRNTWFRISGILHGLRKFEDFRTVLPILDLVKGKFPSEIQQKLHDLEFQSGADFDLHQIMHHLDNIIASKEKYEDSTTLRSLASTLPVVDAKEITTSSSALQDKAGRALDAHFLAIALTHATMTTIDIEAGTARPRGIDTFHVALLGIVRDHTDQRIVSILGHQHAAAAIGAPNIACATFPLGITRVHPTVLHSSHQFVIVRIVSEGTDHLQRMQARPERVQARLTH